MARGMRAAAVLLLALAARPAAGAGCSTIGTYKTSEGCCRCKEGYVKPAGLEEDADAECTSCAPGYAKDQATGRCGAGRAGTPCSEEAAYPYWGCARPSDGTVLGTCTTNLQGEDVFPCRCYQAGTAVPCATLATATQVAAGDADTNRRSAGVLAEPSGRCYPAGARMHTTFPNEPTAGHEFMLTVVGCKQASEVLLMAAGTECTAQPPWAAFNGTNCTVSASAGEAVDVEARLAACDGVLALTDLAPGAGDLPRDGMTEVEFPRLVAPAGAYRVCTQRRLPSGNMLWTSISSHNTAVNERDDTFAVLAPAEEGWKLRGAAGGDGEGDCCDDGLKLGVLCIHWLIVVTVFTVLTVVLLYFRKRNHDVSEELHFMAYTHTAKGAMKLE
eukprot:TRINITY_DN1118_c0_g2_i1.p1 TRINITY_DN1118_c0_g2~~TRINITY_DN1118_c0_g2_i1.p1  ORF type:complete len:387 (+),score=105.80 TRINITY_DN1118_c0_g2_i1:70-1230(+)